MKVTKNYMNEHKTIEKGSPEYIDFLVDFMMNENTHKLNSYPNSDAIKEYATAYILSSETQPITKNDGKFVPIPNNMKGKTINQLKGSKGWYHSIIITDGRKGSWKYCGNSLNRKDANLSKATALSYRIIRIR